MRVVVTSRELEESTYCRCYDSDGSKCYPVAENDLELDLDPRDVLTDDDLEEIVMKFKDEIIEILVRDYFDDVKQAVEEEERRAKRKSTRS